MSDTGKLQGSDEEQVGYGHPPKTTRFKPGDPKINRKGRPKSFDAWRKLNVAILNEVAKDKDGKPIIINGHIATNAEMIVRSKIRDSKHQSDVIEAAFGKVPQLVELTGRDGEGLIESNIIRIVEHTDLTIPVGSSNQKELQNGNEEK